MMVTVKEQIRDLRSRATWCGVMEVNRRGYQNRTELLYFLKYYFDASGDELGYTSFEGESFENITLFDTPRVWHASFTAKFNMKSME